jgi:hypothetical protein
MKKYSIILILIVASLFSYAHALNDIDEQGIKNQFHANFKDAQGESWSENSESYVVYFISKGVQQRVIYMRNGLATIHRRYYTYTELPIAIQHMLAFRLPKQKVFGIVESTIQNHVEQTSSLKYDIMMEDAKKWYQVIINDERELTIARTFKK